MKLSFLLFSTILGVCGAAPSSPVLLSNAWRCPSGYSLAPTSGGLNGDLNQSAGGKDILLCLALDAVPLYGLKIQQNRNCGSGWNLTPTSGGLNGDLNQGAGGKDIFLCYSKNPGQGGTKKIRNIYLTERRPAENLWMPARPDGLNGDLNQSAGGKDIFLEIFREEGSTNWLPSESSFYGALTNYNFGRYPNPGYEPADVCVPIVGGLGVGCTAVGPCWHAQQMVSFADKNYLYTFYTMSQERHGKVYLLRAPLTKANSNTLPAVESRGTVLWYEQTTNFNHPGDLVISGRIILTANQNWDPMEDKHWGMQLGCDVPGTCTCKSNLASRRQALTMWDFGDSLTSPRRYTIDKSTFNRILPEGDKMDNSDADDLWGGNVDGHLVINFEDKWLHFKGTSLGNVRSWERISVTGTNYPSCPGEVNGSSKLFTTINGKSYLASFETGNNCYSLRPASYDNSRKKLAVSCTGMISQCTRGGQLVHSSRDKDRAFQTITQGPTGQVFLTSLHMYGTQTQVVASAPL